MSYVAVGCRNGTDDPMREFLFRERNSLIGEFFSRKRNSLIGAVPL